MTIAIPRLDRSTAAERGLTIADFLVPIRVGERLNARVRDSRPDRRRRAAHLPDALCRGPARPRARGPARPSASCWSVARSGLRRGLLAVALYVLLGVVGLPFFAEGKGGTSVISGATGGYLIGFIVAGAVVGRLAELGWDRASAERSGRCSSAARSSTRSACRGWRAVADLTPSETIAAGLTPFILWDAVKLAVAAGLFPVAWWVVGRRPDDR